MYVYVYVFIYIDIYIYTYIRYVQKEQALFTYTYTCAKSEKPRPKYPCEKVPTIQDKEIQSTCLRSWLQLTTSYHPSGGSSTSIIATKNCSISQKEFANQKLGEKLSSTQLTISPTTSGPFSENLCCGRFLPRLSMLHR